MSDITREEFDELRRQVTRNTERLASGDTALALIDKELKQINSKLAKRWETLSGAVMSYVATALLAYIAVRLGIS